MFFDTEIAADDLTIEHGRRQGRRRPVERPAPQRRHARLQGRPAPRPGSPSTTRTPSAPAAAGSPSARLPGVGRVALGQGLDHDDAALGRYRGQQLRELARRQPRRRRGEHDRPLHGLGRLRHAPRLRRGAGRRRPLAGDRRAARRAPLRAGRVRAPVSRPRAAHSTRHRAWALRWKAATVRTVGEVSASRSLYASWGSWALTMLSTSWGSAEGPASWCQRFRATRRSSSASSRAASSLTRSDNQASRRSGPGGAASAAAARPLAVAATAAATLSRRSRAMFSSSSSTARPARWPRTSSSAASTTLRTNTPPATTDDVNGRRTSAAPMPTARTAKARTRDRRRTSRASSKSSCGCCSTGSIETFARSSRATGPMSRSGCLACRRRGCIVAGVGTQVGDGVGGVLQAPLGGEDRLGGVADGGRVQRDAGRRRHPGHEDLGEAGLGALPDAGRSPEIVGQAPQLGDVGVGQRRRHGRGRQDRLAPGENSGVGRGIVGEGVAAGVDPGPHEGLGRGRVGGDVCAELALDSLCRHDRVWSLDVVDRGVELPHRRPSLARGGRRLGPRAPIVCSPGGPAHTVPRADASSAPSHTLSRRAVTVPLASAT